MIHGIRFNKLILKNFLSFGAQPTTINLTGNRITVILGRNLDSGGEESKNGVGKSAISDALSYCLYGKTIRDISNAKLVNKMIRKGQGMLVILEMDTPSGSYRIERGESPSKLKLYRKDLDNDDDFLTRDGKTYIYDISRNKNETTNEIEGIIGFDIKLFEFLIVNSSESLPFMKLPEQKKREIAERLMGLNLLTERADVLKEDRKGKKTELVAVDSALAATEQANKRIERQIQDLKTREQQWEIKRKSDIATLQTQIEKLNGVNIDEQIEILEILATIDEEDKRINAARKTINLELSQARRDLNDIEKQVERKLQHKTELAENKKKIDKSICPTCNQHWVADPSVVDTIINEMTDIDTFIKESDDHVTKAKIRVGLEEARLLTNEDESNELAKTVDDLGDFDLMFDSVTEANEAGMIIETNEKRIDELSNSENPHTDTIKGLSSEAIKDVNQSESVELRKLIAHYNYLIDLLQSKDSFLRKAVIERWLPKLNGRINNYLETLELPFKVRLTNELGMEITKFDHSYDFYNLSKGQRQRVTIALNLAFQDLFESTNQPLSLLMLDELIDNGIDARGAEQSLDILQKTCDKKDKRVLLITHRNDISDTVVANGGDVMVVELKNTISSIASDEEIM